MPSRYCIFIKELSGEIRAKTATSPPESLPFLSFCFFFISESTNNPAWASCSLAPGSELERLLWGGEDVAQGQ